MNLMKNIVLDLLECRCMRADIVCAQRRMNDELVSDLGFIWDVKWYVATLAFRQYFFPSTEN